MAIYSLDFREGELILGAALAALVFAYWAWKDAGQARSAAWSAYDEIHSHRTQVEESPHEDNFEWVDTDAGQE